MHPSSFGETVKVLHSLHEPFTTQSGGKLLQQFKFDQKKTKIAEVMAQLVKPIYVVQKLFVSSFCDKLQQP
jgi:midasin (ATPase involved in ribosome maturation)